MVISLKYFSHIAPWLQFFDALLLFKLLFILRNFDSGERFLISVLFVMTVKIQKSIEQSAHSATPVQLVWASLICGMELSLLSTTILITSLKTSVLFFCSKARSKKLEVTWQEKKFAQYTRKYSLKQALQMSSDSVNSLELRDAKVESMDREQWRKLVIGKKESVSISGKTESTFEAEQWCSRRAFHSPQHIRTLFESTALRSLRISDTLQNLLIHSVTHLLFPHTDSSPHFLIPHSIHPSHSAHTS